MKAFRHRVEIHNSEGRFLGAAEFKTFTRQRSERALHKALLTNVATVVRSPKEHVCTFELNKKVEIAR